MPECILCHKIIEKSEVVKVTDELKDGTVLQSADICKSCGKLLLKELMKQNYSIKNKEL